MVFGMLGGGLVVAPVVARAATAENCSGSSGSFLGFPTWYKYLQPSFNDTTKDCSVQFDIKQDIPKVLLAVFEIILRVAGLVAVGYVVYGGFMYLISQGEPDRVKGAKTTIINAVIGLAIAISATAIVNLVASNIV